MALILLLAAVAGLGGAGPAAASATCADYPNQAAAQRAADTRDADHDGIYCESLPCPCLKPGSSSTGAGGVVRPPPAPPPASPTGAGTRASVTLGPVTRAAGCRLRGPLPDPRCTPGARFIAASRSAVCRSGYAHSVRDVPPATRQAVYRAYGLSRRFNGADGELDHLVSLELGGSNAAANLFPEAATPRPGSHEKDRLENALHAEVCAGRLALGSAQRRIAVDWVSAYHLRLG
jgi:5-methylcytosine-specific restriction endonuclease McrA